MSADPRQESLDLFASHFGGAPEFLIRSPGRVNLIGDHTDYNDGFVLPMAIDRAIWLAARARRDRRLEVVSVGHPAIGLDLDAIERVGAPWGEYVAGIAWSLTVEGLPLRGWEGAYATDIPTGASLSSSAALEMATARAAVHVAGEDWKPTEMALAARRAENEWVGVASGIMDQLVVAAADPDNALFIDCRTMETSPVALPEETAVVVVDTGTRRSLVDSAYNERRAACEAAAQLLGVRALRDVDMAMLGAADLADPVLRRARHVVTENRRVLDVVDALRHGDPVSAGRLMIDSHVSLRDDYEVSAAALDLLVDILVGLPGVHGARMTGAGFGGCVVALVQTDAVDAVLDSAVASARGSGLASAAGYLTRPVGGTSLLPLAPR